MTSGTGNGFTLAELCVAGMIIGLICMLCWPPLREYTQTMTARTSARQLVQKLYAARENAVLSGQPQYESGAAFFPDGSAEYFQASFDEAPGRTIVVEVEETGQVDVHG